MNSPADIPNNIVTWNGSDRRYEVAVKRAIAILLPPMSKRSQPSFVVGYIPGHTLDLILLNDATFVISSYVNINGINSESAKQSFVQNALLSLSDEVLPSIDQVQKAIASEVWKYYQTPLEEFTVIFPSNILLSGLPLRGVFRFGGNTLTFRKWSYIKQRLDLSEWNEHMDQYFSGSKWMTSNACACVVCTLKAHDHGAAFRSAWTSWDQMRALFNLTEGFGQLSWNMGGGLLKDLAQVLPPVLTPVYKGSVYEMVYSSASGFFYKQRFATIKPEQFRRFRAWGRYLDFAPKPIPKVVLIKDLIATAVVRYGNALESLQREECFLELWRILEMISLRGTAEDFKMEEVRRRTRILLGDREQLVDFLYISYRLRNTYVHTGIFPDDLQFPINALKQAVDMSIIRLLNLSKKITTCEMLEAYYACALLSEKQRSDRKKVLLQLESQSASVTNSAKG